MNKLETEERTQLLALARDSITEKLLSGRDPNPDLDSYPDKFRETAAAFVTLTIHRALRGCIGSLYATRPLLHDIANHACNAAFNDPRFPPLTLQELEKTTISISILTNPESVDFENEQQLLAQIKPGKDGIILKYKEHKATFLPAVWRELPEVVRFMQQLKLKAGLSAGFWSEDISIERYHSMEFSEHGP